MCGICGKVSFNGPLKADAHDTVERMTRVMNHRGPDEEGFYVSTKAALGHARLKIIDLHNGKQPLSNEDRTIWVVFNGEIYNFKELRHDLIAKGHQFRTATDTEVIVHLYEEYGEHCVTKLSGMFSFALWDNKEHVLLAARDRVGIKPLYYSLTNKSFLFASEIKAILAEGSVKAEVDPSVLDRFLTFYYMPGNQTLFQGIKKLDPGHYIVIQDGKVRIEQYWDLVFPVIKHSGSIDESIEALTALLRDTVRAYMISDVPVGVLLSGGVDSTAMLSFASEETDKQINTFTVGFAGREFADERPYAKLAAKQYGSQHHEMTISSAEFFAFLPKYIFHMEEPVCEPPAIALYYVSKMAKEYVTVLLSGEGGDEVFAGYPNYRNLVCLEGLKQNLGPMSASAAKVMNLFGGKMKRYASYMPLSLNEYYYSRTSGPFEYFNRYKKQYYVPEFQKNVCRNYSQEPIEALFARTSGMSVLNKMLYVDSKSWLPDDLLIKADKITMANSLELRVPLLDHKVLEFGAALPEHWKIRGFSTKYILKKALERRVPQAIIRRKKTGFPVPYVSWLKNEHKDAVNSILTDSRTLGRGYFSPAAIEHLLEENRAKGTHAKEIFSLIVLELWHRTFIDGKAVSLQ